MNIKRLLQFINIMILLVLSGLFILSYFNEKGFQEKVEKLTKRDIMLLVALNDMYAQGLQTGQATRNIFINPKDEQAKKNYQKAHQEFMKSNEEAIKYAKGEMQEQLKKIAQLWQKDHAMKVEVHYLAEEGKKDEAVKKNLRRDKVMERNKGYDF